MTGVYDSVSTKGPFIEAYEEAECVLRTQQVIRCMRHVGLNFVWPSFFSCVLLLLPLLSPGCSQSCCWPLARMRRPGWQLPRVDCRQRLPWTEQGLRAKTGHGSPPLERLATCRVLRTLAPNAPDRNKQARTKLGATANDAKKQMLHALCVHLYFCMTSCYTACAKNRRNQRQRGNFTAALALDGSSSHALAASALAPSGSRSCALACRCVGNGGGDEGVNGAHACGYG